MIYRLLCFLSYYNFDMFISILFRDYCYILQADCYVNTNCEFSCDIISYLNVILKIQEKSGQKFYVKEKGMRRWSRSETRYLTGY